MFTEGFAPEKESQHAERILNKIENTFNETFTVWKSMRQELRI